MQQRVCQPKLLAQGCIGGVRCHASCQGLLKQQAHDWIPAE